MVIRHDLRFEAELVSYSSCPAVIIVLSSNFPYYFTPKISSTESFRWHFVINIVNYFQTLKNQTDWANLSQHIKIELSTLEFTSLGWFLFHFTGSLPGSHLSVISRIDMHLLQSFSHDYFPQTRFYETLLFSPVLQRYTSKLYFIINPKQDSRVKYIWELLQYCLSLLQHHATYIGIVRNQINI